MKGMRGKIAGCVMFLLICSMFAGTTVHAELIRQSNKYLSIYNLTGTAAVPITTPKTFYAFYIGYSDKYDSTLKVTSSNKNAIKISKYQPVVQGFTILGFKFRGVKPGTSTVKAVFKDTGGTNITKSAKFRAYQWTNPFRMLKIGKKNYTNAFRKTFKKNISPVSGKLSIRMNSSYKRLKVYYIAKGSNTREKISSGTKVELKEGDKLLFRFNDNRHRVSNVEAYFAVE